MMNQTKAADLCPCGSGLFFLRCHGSVMNNAGELPLGKGNPNAPKERVSIVGFPGTYQTLHMMFRFKGDDPHNALPSGGTPGRPVASSLYPARHSRGTSYLFTF